MSVASFSIRRRITVLMVALGVLVFGGFSLNRLELKLLPEISYPALTVRTELEGAPPQEIEELISRPIEETLGVITHLQQITSISRAGLSDVIIEFHWNTSMDRALMDVREKLDTVVFPETADRPRILRYNPETEPILKMAMTGEDLVALHLLAENEIKPRLETLEGIAAARISGGEEEEILVAIDTSRLAAIGLSLTDVSQQIEMENINIPGGMLEEGKTQFLVRTVNEFKTIEDIGQIIIGSRNGIEVRLHDIASIQRTRVDRKTITHLDGKESVLIEIYKEGDANIISATDAVRTELGKRLPGHPVYGKSILAVLPEEMQIEIVSDQSVFIREAINEVRTAAVMGCFLAIFILYLFMRNLGNTLIIGLSIPISVIATFTLMYFKHISLNLMSLGGLALGIGMLVDNSIVVLENIFRLRENGYAASESARAGTEQVTTAVIASTLTTVAVFFPIAFVKGIAGQIFGDLAWTIAFSLLASLIVALSVIPMIASLRYQSVLSDIPADHVIAIARIWQKHRRLGGVIREIIDCLAKLFRSVFADIGRPVRIQNRVIAWILTVGLFPIRLLYAAIAFITSLTSAVLTNGSWLFALIPIWSIRKAWHLIHWMLKPLLFVFEGAYSRIHRAYIGLLRRSLEKPYRAPVIVFVLFLLSSFWIGPRLGMNLIPAMSQGEFLIDIRLPVGSPLEKTRDIVMQVESQILEMPEIQSVSAVIGSDMTTGASLGTELEHVASLQVLLKVGVRNRTDENRIIDCVRHRLTKVSGIEKAEFRRPALFTLKTPLEVEIRSNDLDRLIQQSEDLVVRLQLDDSFTDVSSTMEAGYPEIEVVFDRVKLARIGMNPSEAASILRTAVDGDIPTDFGTIGEEVDIRIRSERTADLSITGLEQIVINPDNETPIYLNAVAKITRTIGPSEIRRVNQRRVALIRAEAPILDLKKATDHLVSILDDVPSTPGVHYAITGQTREMEESARSLVIALLMAVFLVYLVMASQFESLILPFIILVSIPMAMIGVLWGLYTLTIPMSIVIFIGLIVLSGIVVNNAIVLVDMTNQLYRMNMPLLTAVQTAADQRLRPILMTAATTILGLLPMAFSIGPGQEIRQPLAVTIILGMVASTFLTLIVIPTLYYIVEYSLHKFHTINPGGDAGGH
ncbi:efflux RND transporter permease subunit [bacterium]|nr:efflux RND transporter permease subunit [candidate division CSSED10-310 bacterium]